MGLFGEEDEETPEGVDPSALEDESGPDASAQADDGSDTAPADPEEDPSAEAESGASPDDQAPEDGEPSDGGSGARDDIDVEDALKDLSARMSVLSSNLEGVQDTRGELEDKIGDVEERMSRLGSLAEAVSSEYNPFVSENAPDQPSWTPEQEDGEAGEDPASLPSSHPEAQADPAESAGDPPGEGPPAEPAPDLEDQPPMPKVDPRSLEASQETEQAPGTAPLPQHDRAPPRRRREKPGHLEESLILLEWVGMMLDRVGRAGLMDLLDYYRNLGWLDPDTKDQVTRVAVGVEAPDRVGEGQWRGDVDLHRRSLVAIQRLQGDEIPAARLDELELDLRRLFRE